MILNLPENLRTTDFKVFEALYNIVLETLKNDINRITDLKNVDKCVSHMLPYLSNSIGAPYFNDTTPEVNREIIKNWWWLMKNKGTLRALQTAALLGLMAFNAQYNKQNNTAISLLDRSVDILTDPNTSEIYVRISYQNLDEMHRKEQENWITTLINYVRPAGFRINLSPSQFVRAFLNITSQHNLYVYRTSVNATSSTVSDASMIVYNFNDGDTTNSNVGSRYAYKTINLNDKISTCTSGFGFYVEDNPIIDGKPSIPTPCSTCSLKTYCKEFTTYGVGQEELTKN